MIGEWLLDLDYYLLLFVNERHSPLLDWVMVLLTKPLPWIPLYVAILVAIIYKWGVKQRDYKSAVLIIIAAIATFAITDMGSSFIKGVVTRYRPAWDPMTAEVIRLLDGKGGYFGFPSSHAANVFGLATVTSLFFKNRYYRYSIFVWAAGVSYSRVYVGRHFPSDILAGALMGILVGWILGKLLHHYLKSKV